MRGGDYARGVPRGFTPLVLALAVAAPAGGCEGGSQPTTQRDDACVEVLAYRDQSELCDIAPLPDGYVLNAFQRIVVYELDDTPRFEIPGDFEGFGTTADGRIVTVRLDGGAVVGEAWSADDGASLGEVARIEDPDRGLDPKGVLVLGDGRVQAWGGDFKDWWVATSGEPFELSETVGVDDVRVLADGRQYVLSKTITVDDGRYWHQDLSLYSAGGQLQWTSPVVTLDADTTQLRAAQFVGTVGDEVYLSVEGGLSGEPRPVEIRRYDATGALVSSQTQTYEPWGAPGRRARVRATVRRQRPRIRCRRARRGRRHPARRDGRPDHPLASAATRGLREHEPLNRRRRRRPAAPSASGRRGAACSRLRGSPSCRPCRRARRSRT